LPAPCPNPRLPPAFLAHARTQTLAQLFLACLIAGLMLCAKPVVAQTLYDGSLGTFPGDQDWIFVILGVGTQSYMEKAVLLDTSASMSTQAGYSRVSSAPLDRTAGFTLQFTAQLHAESHNNANRAGFSVIALGDDKHGIELGFWKSLIFAQADSPLLTHAEEAAFATTNAFVDYALTIGTTNYVLRADGMPLLGGPVRDYSAFNGLINPYRTPNFLFFGDDTSSASGSVSLRDIVLITAPSVTIQDAKTICWKGVDKQSYTVQVSTNLIEWDIAGSVTSSTPSFCFTNDSPAAIRFFRVAYP
jgi:hypothetical protein